MNTKINRRTFMIRSAQVTTSLVGLSLLPGLSITRAFAEEPKPAPSPADISVVTGTDYFKATIRAVENLGGIGKFISKGDTVGLLSNTWAKKPGTYTKPEVVLAVAHLCFEAGAKEVYLLKNESEKYWRRSTESEKHQKLISRLKSDDSDHKTMTIPGAKALKEAKVLQGTFKHDKLINLPIIKNHSGPGMTCNLKNMMGLTAFSTNIKFHLGENYVRNFVKDLGNFFYDMDHFSQCVADLCLVRKVDLCVVDATEFITTNGPTGPGKMSRPNQVVAGTDQVALDALCCGYLGMNPGDVGMITKAQEHKIGNADFEKLTISRTTI